MCQEFRNRDTIELMASDTVAQIKDRLSIQDVIAPYVKLRRAGRSLVGLCPFHKEKSGSFHVSVERGTFHCFGCGEGGDAFTFIEKIEGVDFKGAMKILAEKAGVRVEYDPRAKERSDKLERLREAMGRATQWYAGKLAATDAEAYAKKRGLTSETIKSWELGYAPDGWRALLEALANEGFSVDELRAAGLIKEADGKPGTYYDRFRNRLMFPIRDTAGRVVAFTGRTLSAGRQGPSAEVEVAKYLNSPETDLFHKSDVLYGMDRAKDAIRTRGFTMLVEGQMDVLHCHQSGWGNAVALSGTALTARHLGLMKRFSDNLMLVLDSDSAGLNATVKSAALALREGLRVKAARLPEGKDPADLITENPKEFAERVKDAKPIVEFFLGVLGEKEKDPHRLLRLCEQVVLPLIANMGSPMEREHFIQVTARTLSLSPESIRETLPKVRPSDGAGDDRLKVRPSNEGARPQERDSAREGRAKMLRAVILAYPDSALAKRIENEYSRITEAPVPSDALPEYLVFQAEQHFGEEPSEGAADELLSAFEEAVVREAYQEHIAALRSAESRGDPAEIERAGKACAELSARLAALGR